MKIAITIYYNGKTEPYRKIDKRNQIDRLKLIYPNFDSYEINFFDLDDLPPVEKEHCKNCGAEIE